MIPTSGRAVYGVGNFGGATFVIEQVIRSEPPHLGLACWLVRLRNQPEAVRIVWVESLECFALADDPNSN